MPGRVGGLSRAGTASCRNCPARWSALGLAHCAQCHRTYADTRLFDLHRRGYGQHGQCQDPALLRDHQGYPLMILQDGVWRSSDLRVESLSPLDSEGEVGQTAATARHVIPGHPRKDLSYMAQKVTLVDDVEASRGVEVRADVTYHFSVGEKRYTLDLTSANAAHFDSALAPFIAVATPAAGRAKGGSGDGRKSAAGSAKSSSGKSDPEKTNAIRAWARSQGLEVNDRGRIPGTIIEQYETAGSPSLEEIQQQSPAMPVSHHQQAEERSLPSDFQPVG